MQLNETEERILDKQLDEICEGFREIVDNAAPVIKPMRRQKSRRLRKRTIGVATEAAF